MMDSVTRNVDLVDEPPVALNALGCDVDNDEPMAVSLAPVDVRVLVDDLFLDFQRFAPGMPSGVVVEVLRRDARSAELAA